MDRRRGRGRGNHRYYEDRDRLRQKYEERQYDQNAGGSSNYNSDYSWRNPQQNQEYQQDSWKSQPQQDSWKSQPQQDSWKSQPQQQNFRSNYRGGRGRGARGIPPKHPAHLKGREIGLYYAKLQAERSKKDNFLHGPNLSLTPSKIQEFRSVLSDLHFDTNKDSYFTKDFQKYAATDYEKEVLKSLKKYEIILEDRKEIMVMSDEILYYEFLNTIQTEKYLEMQNFRETLPAFPRRQEILEMIYQNQVVLIKGETGCGKTTQIPQYILDHALWNGQASRTRIVCTQPRRIAAISVAQRVAEERGESLGESSGYHIRLEKVLPRTMGSMLFCTTQVIQKIMENDPSLSEFSHIIIDEIHERQVHVDILMGLIQQLIKLRKDIKVILMSATLQAEAISKYFHNCPTFHIEGKMYPVQEIYLEEILDEVQYYNFPEIEKNKMKKLYFSDYRDKLKMLERLEDFEVVVSGYVNTKLKDKVSNQAFEILQSPYHEHINEKFIEELIFHIAETKPSGAILVFLPGYSIISKLFNNVTTSPRYSPDRFVVYPLHSILTGNDQYSIFRRPRAGVRKVILATQIAETSITVDDVVYIINSGFYKKSFFDSEKSCNSLEQMFITKANEIQRKGRAGRVQEGICYNLYTKARSRALEQFEKPEILCIRLEEAILGSKILYIKDVRSFFKCLINVPDDNMVEMSMKFLERLNALDENDNITPLGLHLARIPVSPQIGKMVLLGSIFSCFDPITTIAASLSFKTPFYSILGKEKELKEIKLRLSQNTESDHLTMAYAVEEWRQYREKFGNDTQFCFENFMSATFLKQIEDMKQQFGEMLCVSKFLTTPDPTSPEHNQFSKNSEIVCSIICGGLYPNIALKRVKIKNNVARPNIKTIYGAVKLIDGSVNAVSKKEVNSYLVYHMRQKLLGGTYLLDASSVSPYAVVFFGDHVKFEDTDDCSYLSIGEIAKFKCDKETAELIFDLREGLNKILEDKICHPSPTFWQAEEGKLLNAILKLITMHGKEEEEEELDGEEEDDEDETETPETPNSENKTPSEEIKSFADGNDSDDNVLVNASENAASKLMTAICGANEQDE